MALMKRAARAIGVAGPPRADRWDRWSANDPDSRLTVNHDSWSGFLANYVARGAAGLSVVRYGHVTGADRANLDTYVATLAAAPISRLAPAEQFAYWVNLYNALTVRVVLDHYPVASIRDIKLSGPLGRGPWDKKLVVIEGEGVGIGDIEHRILRPIWRDPRVHFVLNCASHGCPDLGTTAFVAGRADESLDRAARAFINHPRGARRDGPGLVLSSIFDWYAQDFAPEGPIAFIRRHADPTLAAALDEARRVDYDYDWRLNDANGCGEGAQP